jgi:hypothetical protein
MKLDLFSTPIWIGNIDSSKIELEYEETKKTWLSETKSSFLTENKITNESIEYILKVIVSLLDETPLPKYRLEMGNIWENTYEDNDFQEAHIHAHSDLSFIIYKKIKEARTVFLNANRYLLESFYQDDKKKKLFGNDVNFLPKCKENQIVLFPSHLEHFVKKTNNALTISGNLKLHFNKDVEKK